MTDRPLRQCPLADLDLNEAARPVAPKFPNVTDQQLLAGRHLRAIHRHHLMELSKARAVYRHVCEGNKDPSALLAALEGMDLTQNYRLFGNLCGRECRMLEFHHDAEEHHVFPVLEQKGESALRLVVAKLRQEHEVVHELLLRLEEVSHDLVDAPSEDKFTEAAEIFDKLEAVVRSHFGYEETELKEALGIYVPAI